MKIRNAEALAITPARRDVLAIAEAGLAAVDTAAVVRGALRREGDKLSVGENIAIDLASAGRVIFVAVGKCAADSAPIVEEVLGDRLSGGVVIDVKSCAPSAHLKTFRGTHPLPSDDNLAAAEAVVGVLRDLTERDIVLFVVSGGGSTLLFLPENRANREESAIFKELTARGAAIQEMNTVRKHLSLARGGWLARYAYPARVISLVFSDVPGNELGTIASAPTVRDETTVADAAEILRRFGILERRSIEQCGLIETPKEECYFERVANLIIVSNERALEAMKRKAGALGYRSEIKDAKLSMDAIEAAQMINDDISAATPGTVFLWGGEMTVRVGGNGRGGRNLTLAAAGLGRIEKDEEILSLASDGRDHGPFAGALCDTITKEAAVRAGLQPEAAVAASDTYPFFESVGQYVMTGDTGSNVSDLIIALKYKS